MEIKTSDNIAYDPSINTLHSATLSSYIQNTFFLHLVTSSQKSLQGTSNHQNGEQIVSTQSDFVLIRK